MKIGIWVAEHEQIGFTAWTCQSRHHSIFLHNEVQLERTLLQRQLQLIIASPSTLPQPYLRAWRVRAPEIDWIFVTTTPSYEWAEAIMLSGAAGFCSLPLIPEHLNTLIDNLKARYQQHTQTAPVVISGEIDLALPIESALVYITEHITEHITLRDVSRAVYLSPSHFSRLFTQRVGIPFNEYVLTRRIEAAKALLADTPLPIELIASKVGMTSASQFSQTFKRVTGSTPRAYRHACTTIC
jgi:AraC-like DNA-binding protein